MVDRLLAAFRHFNPAVPFRLVPDARGRHCSGVTRAGVPSAHVTPKE